MTSTHRWMTRQDYARLQNELSTLRSRRSIEVPDDLMDYDANLPARQSARQIRIREIQDLLSNAVIDGNPVGDPIAQPGMVLTIRYDVSGETETFLLGRRGAEDADIKAYSMASPLGRAIAGARPGDQRIYSVPNETGQLVTVLEAVPYEMHVAKRPRPQFAHRDATVTGGH
ncbi:MAG: GreA/GreB family elongation factor [Mycobacterium sp.]